MRSYPSCWNKTLAQLGFRRKRRKTSKRQDLYNRRSLFERLEERQMLSGDPLFDLSSEETVVAAGVTPESFAVFSSQPEFFLIQPEIPAEELEVLTQEELDELKPLFAVKTVETRSGPQAIVSFNPTYAGTPPSSLQELRLELRQDGRVVETYEILIDIAEESFREQFLADRIEAVASEVKTIDPPEEFDRPWEIRGLFRDAKSSFPDRAPGYKDAGYTAYAKAISQNEARYKSTESAPEVEYLKKFIGPLTLEQHQVLDKGLTEEKSQLAKETVAPTDQLISLAKRQSEWKDVLVDDTEREQFYGDLEEQIQAVKQDRLSAKTEVDRQAVAEREKAFRNTTLLLAKDLQQDLQSDNTKVALVARKLRDELVAISSPYETAFVGLGVDREIERKFSNNGDEKSVSFVETGHYVFNDQLEIDLGKHQAMVQVTRSSRFRAAASSYILGSPAVEDGSISEASPNSNGGSANSLHVDGTPGSLQESLIRFKLADVADFDDPTTLASAALQLFEIGAGVGNAEVYVWNGLFGGPAGSVTDWDETNINWNHVDGTLDLEGNLSEFTQLSDWAAGITTEIDVTSQLQRALLYGDANGDGQFSAAEFDGDIEAFHLAVTDWDAYVAEYGPRANSPADLLARTDGGLGDGTLDTNDIADFFRRHGFSQGDYNLDGTVQDNQDSGLDGLDWAVFNANYGLKHARFSQGDGNFDGVVDDDDFDIWFNRQGEDNLTPVEPEIVFWVRPEDATTDIEFGSQEHFAFIGPTLVLEEQPDLALNRFSVQGNNLLVDYAVLGTDFTNVKVQIYKTGSPDTLLHETSVQSGSLGSHEVLVAASVLSSIVEGDSLYAKVIGTPSLGTQSNTVNDQLDFEFSTASTQIVTSLDDAGMDTLLRSKHTLRELLSANESLGWFDTLTFDNSGLFDNGRGVITFGDHDQDNVADQINLDTDVTINGPGSHLLTLDARGGSRLFQISSNTEVTLKGVTLTGGYTTSVGGGIYSKGADLTLDQVVMLDNQSGGVGGGLRANSGGSLKIYSSSFQGNHSGTSGGGVGVFLGATDSLIIDKSTFYNNTAVGGAGIKVYGNSSTAGATASITNSTFSGNTSSSSGGGISLHSISGTGLLDVTIINSTITKNEAIASVAGGIFNIHPASVAVTLHNTIVADNTSGYAITAIYQDTWGNLNGTTGNESSHNLIGVGATGGHATGLVHGNLGNLIGSVAVPFDPMLAPLDTYGGQTPTHVLYENSPAIDSGSDDQAVDATGNPLLFDQGGFSRIQDVEGIPNGGVSIGAVEDQQSPLFVQTLDDTGQSGLRTLRDAINVAREWGVDTDVIIPESLFNGQPNSIELQDQPVDKEGVPEWATRAFHDCVHGYPQWAA